LPATDAYRSATRQAGPETRAGVIEKKAFRETLNASCSPECGNQMLNLLSSFTAWSAARAVSAM
jgi:hypothetical protein